MAHVGYSTTHLFTRPASTSGATPEGKRYMDSRPRRSTISQSLAEAPPEVIGRMGPAQLVAIVDALTAGATDRDFPDE